MLARELHIAETSSPPNSKQIRGGGFARPLGQFYYVRSEWNHLFYFEFFKIYINLVKIDYMTIGLDIKLTDVIIFVVGQEHN